MFNIPGHDFDPSPVSSKVGTMYSSWEKMGVASGLTIKVAYLLGRNDAAASIIDGLVCNLLSLQGIDTVGSNSKGGLHFRLPNNNKKI